MAARASRMPASNTDYWNKKIEHNRINDEKNRQALEALGWRIGIIWECETAKSKLKDSLDRIEAWLTHIDS